VPTPPSTPLRSVLAGRYQLDALHASGASSELYRGYDLRERRPIAVKIPRASRVDTPERRKSFLDEARMLQQLEHRSIVRVLDVVDDEHAPFIVTEWLKGVTLADALATAQKFSALDAATLIAPAVEALAFAHASGFVHRDFKPANVFLCVRSDGSVEARLLDFGIARAITNTARSAHDREFVATGSPTYMAPERVRFESHGDARADVWSVGVTMFELVAGHAPFEERSLAKLFARIGQDDAPAIESIEPGVDRGYAMMVRRCLRRAPEARYQSAGELAEDLQRMIAVHPPRAFLMPAQRSGVQDKLDNDALGATHSIADEDFEF
jgi:serine/threonine protein kinase